MPLESVLSTGSHGGTGKAKGGPSPLGGTLLAAYEGSAQWTLLTAWADDAAAGAAVSLLQSAPALLSTQALPLHGTPLAQWPREGYWRLALEEAGPGRWAGPRGTGCYVLDDGDDGEPWGFAATRNGLRKMVATPWIEQGTPAL